MTDTLQLELWLRNWSETSNGGANISFTVHPEDLEPFKAMTLAKGSGKKAVAGQRFQAVLVPIADDETPEKLPVGSICRSACVLCRERSFHEWLRATWPTLWRDVAPGAKTDEETAKLVLYRMCGIESRKELDNNAAARRTFVYDVRKPYSEWFTNARTQ